MPHLLVALSGHGFGHLAQVAPVVDALHQAVPRLRLTLRTLLPRTVLEARIAMPFQLQAVGDDFGMCNTTALDVDPAASILAYRSVHRCWQERVDRVAKELAGTRPDLILADVPYLTLAAAAEARIPSIAMSSLNWADIFGHYCGEAPEAPAILRQMVDAYNAAEVFLRLTPGMAMGDLRNCRTIGPVCQTGRNQREGFAEQFGLEPTARLVLVAMGGMPLRLPFEAWPREAGLRWVVPAAWGVKRDDALVLEDLGARFVDVLASCDVLITKPGYGSFTEAAAVGVPVLYVPREDWPESQPLCEWLEAHGHATAVDRKLLERGEILGALRVLMEQGRYRPVEPDGTAQLVALLAERLQREGGRRQGEGHCR